MRAAGLVAPDVSSALRHTHTRGDGVDVRRMQLSFVQKGDVRVRSFGASCSRGPARPGLRGQRRFARRLVALAVRQLVLLAAVKGKLRRGSAPRSHNLSTMHKQACAPRMQRLCGAPCMGTLAASCRRSPRGGAPRTRAASTRARAPQCRSGGAPSARASCRPPLLAAARPAGEPTGLPQPSSPHPTQGARAPRRACCGALRPTGAAHAARRAGGS